MRTLAKRLCRNRSGNMLLELALVSPIIVAVMIGMIDFGRGAQTSMSLRSAARAGAEYVSRTGDLEKVEVIVAEAANLETATLVVAPIMFCECDGGVGATCGSYCPDGTFARRFISVTAEQPFLTLVPYPMVPRPIQLSGRAILRVQ
jgi:hypothetical protein